MIQYRHKPLSRCSAAGKSDLLLSRRERHMKSWEKAEWAGRRGKKVILVVVCLGPCRWWMLENGRENPARLCGKRGNEETPAVSQERRGCLEVLMRQYSKYGVLFCSVFVFVHISCIWVLCVLYSVAQLDWTKRVFYFYFFTFSCSGSFQFFLYFTGLIPHPD